MISYILGWNVGILIGRKVKADRAAAARVADAADAAAAAAAVLLPAPIDAAPASDLAHVVIELDDDEPEAMDEHDMLLVVILPSSAASSDRSEMRLDREDDEADE
jgi:hypothetical protein